MEISFEFERMKEKRRQLQLKINEMRADISRKEKLVSRLEDDLQRVKTEMQPSDQEVSEGENALNQFMKDICVVIEEIVNDEAFMKAKYATQTSQMYYKIEKDVFEEYINRLSGLAVKDFIEFCKKLSFLKLENNKCVFPSGRTRVYFLTRGLVDGLKN